MQFQPAGDIGNIIFLGQITRLQLLKTLPCRMNREAFAGLGLNLASQFLYEPVAIIGVSVMLEKKDTLNPLTVKILTIR